MSQSANQKRLDPNTISSNVKMIRPFGLNFL